MSVPNQRVIQIGQRVERNKDNVYATMNIDALQYAMKTLNGNSGLLLWLYLNKNHDNFFPIELSQKACAEWGLLKDSYYRAFNELEKHGFLRRKQDNSNIYLFYECGNAVSQNEKQINNTVSHFAKDNSQNEKEFSHIAKGQSHHAERNNTQNNTENTIIKAEASPPPQEEKAIAHKLEGSYPSIDIDTYNSLGSKVEDLGGGLIKLENGRVFKLESNRPFKQPLAYLETLEYNLA